MKRRQEGFGIYYSKRKNFIKVEKKVKKKTNLTRETK